jgi:hypothetical protein
MVGSTGRRELADWNRLGIHQMDRGGGNLRAARNCNPLKPMQIYMIALSSCKSDVIGPSQNGKPPKFRIAPDVVK